MRQQQQYESCGNSSSSRRRTGIRLNTATDLLITIVSMDFWTWKTCRRRPRHLAVVFATLPPRRRNKFFNGLWTEHTQDYYRAILRHTVQCLHIRGDILQHIVISESAQHLYVRVAIQATKEVWAETVFFKYIPSFILHRKKATAITITMQLQAENQQHGCPPAIPQDYSTPSKLKFF